jgi:tellurite resistance protein TehA-like permease
MTASVMRGMSSDTSFSEGSSIAAEAEKIINIVIVVFFLNKVMPIMIHFFCYKKEVIYTLRARAQWAIYSMSSPNKYSPIGVMDSRNPGCADRCRCTA